MKLLMTADATPVAPCADLPEATLVAHVQAQAARPLRPATRERLAQALLDWATAGWSALDLPAAQTLRELGVTLMPSAGPSTVFGGDAARNRVTPLAAGFVNAGIAHLREIDDAHRAAMLHPGVVSVTPVLALAEAHGLTRLQVARAIVAGYEVSLRVGEALGTRHSTVFHATATAGALGAAAAAGVAMGLNTGQLHHALGIAATQAAGLWQLVDDGAHESKSLHPAFAVRNGMTAAHAARAGLPGARAFVTGRRGLRAALAGDGPLAALDGDLDAPERLHTATIKAWPACAQLFTALDATLELIETHGIAAQMVAAVDIRIFAHALSIAGVHWPSRPAQAPFCLRYLVAVLLNRGRIGIADTEAPELHSPTLQALAQRIVVHGDADLQKAYPQRRPSLVSITLIDGRQMRAHRDLRRGDPEDPYSWQALQLRMRAFAPQMDEASAASLVGWCEGFLDPRLDAQPGAPVATVFGPTRC